ncbi:hypothetical protein VXS05_18735 [Photobacterium toruni]|uniref:Uncharacterized protein n=1 Tax=Photobacterium toruni TaxID=1935446 RepID=A0A1T4U0L3_9GAMM|nr:hypothetical protein [Photobacterium toruni]MEC6817056.1 hypothetical protein [Photobacterium toruni]MEC6833396.1 hypothetical protein [Photobacterium toruni]SKA46213.1 hypothetical protein CZ814_02642 [Photobacterium toruni]
MIKFLFINLLFISSAWASPPNISPLYYSADFSNKYGTEGSLASVPKILFIYKEIKGECYMVVRDKSAMISYAKTQADKC